MRKIDEYLQKAEEGDSTAQYWLGKCYLNGIGVEKSDENAAKWFRKSALAGNPMGQCAWGACHFYAKGVKKDIKKGIEWISMSAEQQHPTALYNLALEYMKGRFLQRNIKYAEQLFIMAALLGDAESMNSLGRMYFLIEEVADPEKSLKWYKRGARKGERNAQLQLHFHYTVMGGARNLKKGVRWLKKAAINGNHFAQYILGTYYEKGASPVLKNETRAFRWYYIAAKRGVFQASERLYLCYYFGRGVERNAEKAYAIILNLYRSGKSEYANAVAFIGLEVGADINLIKACSAEAMKRDMLDLDSCDTHGCILLKEGKIDEAISAFEYCRAVNNQRSIFYEHLGDAYMAKNMYGKAISYLKQAMALAKYDFEKQRLQDKLSTAGKI